MEEKPLRRVQRGPLRPNRRQASHDHLRTSRLTTVQDRPDLGEAHAHALTRQHDPTPAQMLIRILTVPSRSPVRHDDAFVLPVPEHMRSRSQLRCCIPDLHDSMMTP